MKKEDRQSTERRYGGFTLLEMLVVMTMITILIAAASAMFRGDESARLRAAVRQMGAVFEQARTLARTRSEPVRVVVLEDADDDERHRRVVAIAAGNGEGWEVVSGRELLPDGVVFDVTQVGVPTELMEVDAGDGEVTAWRYFHLGANGTFSGEGANFVLALGYVEGGEVTVPDDLKVDGFRITAAARPFYFRTPDEIGRNLPER